MIGSTSPNGTNIPVEWCQIKTTASGQRVKFIKPMDRIDRTKGRTPITVSYGVLSQKLRISYLCHVSFS